MKFLSLIFLGVVVILAEETEVVKNFSEETNLYIGELYKELAKVHPGNFIISPLSIQTVFALLNDGAKGETSKQITRGLHLPDSEKKVEETFLRLNKNLQTNDKYTLRSANKIYLGNDFQINDKYKKSAVEVFHSEIQNIDFGKSEEAIAEINGWVEEQTDHKIKNVLSDSQLGASTLAVLVNALYFQGKWVKEFGGIRKTLFRPHKGEPSYIDMMEVSDYYNFYQSPELKAKFLEMPYKGEEVSMVFVLPNEIDGLGALEEHIADVIAAPKFESKRVDVVIPKYKIESTTSLIPALQALGIKDAFSNAADFSGVGDNKQPFSISEVVQKAYIEVDEKGTTAAAATVAVVDKIAGGERIYSFVANHPFLFYLKHRVNGVFFIGRFVNP